jgi:hypothetical protein
MSGDYRKYNLRLAVRGGRTTMVQTAKTLGIDGGSPRREPLFNTLFNRSCGNRRARVWDVDLMQADLNVRLYVRSAGASAAAKKRNHEP